jgi:aminoglycoside phosphotransferase (APT) family kinase protein
VPALDPELLRWVVAVAAPGDELVDVRGLREGGTPWLVRFAATDDVVVRVGSESNVAALEAEVRALEIVNGGSDLAPRLIAADLTGAAVPGLFAVVTTKLAGTSHLATEPTPARLRAMGATVAAIQGVPAAGALPRRVRPIDDVDFAAVRRAAPARPLLADAEQAVVHAAVPVGPDVLVHGDFWFGNTLWDGDVLVGVIDWDCSGTGPAGLDVGSLRCDAALCASPDAADEALAGYEQASGRRAEHVAYWDLVAGLATPPTMDWFVSAIQGQGRGDLDQATLIDRRDAFVAAALVQLRSA